MGPISSLVPLLLLCITGVVQVFAQDARLHVPRNAIDAREPIFVPKAGSGTTGGRTSDYILNAPNPPGFANQPKQPASKGVQGKKESFTSTSVAARPTTVSACTALSSWIPCAGGGLACNCKVGWFYQPDKYQRTYGSCCPNSAAWSNVAPNKWDHSQEGRQYHDFEPAREYNFS